MFNHEGERRGETFVTRKISRGVSEIIKGKKNYLTLGNLEAKRDWGYAEDYVESMWLMMQQKKPSDFVIATGRSHSVREFVEEAFRVVNIEIIWKGSGLKEVGINKKTKKILVKIDKLYKRPTDILELRGDFSKAKNILKWTPRTSFKGLVKKMVLNDLKEI